MIKTLLTLLFFSGLNCVEGTSMSDELTGATGQISRFETLDESLKQEFLRICKSSGSFLTYLFKDAEDVVIFLECNRFCKSFIYRDVRFDEYDKACKIVGSVKKKDTLLVKYLENYILWSCFYQKKFNRDITIPEYKKLLTLSSQFEIYSYEDFSNLIEFNNNYQKIFSRDISGSEYSAVKSFYSFWRSKNNNIRAEDLSKMIYVFLVVGSDKVWRIYETLQSFDNSLESFKTVLLIIFDWDGKFSNQLIHKDSLRHLLIANYIYIRNKKKLMHADFESINSRLLVCPGMDIEKLINLENHHGCKGLDAPPVESEDRLNVIIKKNSDGPIKKIGKVQPVLLKINGTNKNVNRKVSENRSLNFLIQKPKQSQYVNCVSGNIKPYSKAPRQLVQKVDVIVDDKKFSKEQIIPLTKSEASVGNVETSVAAVNTNMKNIATSINKISQAGHYTSHAHSSPEKETVASTEQEKAGAISLQADCKEWRFGAIIYKVVFLIGAGLFFVV